MADLFFNNIYLILFLPLWIFLIIMVGRFFSVYVNKFIIYALTLSSSLLGALACSAALWKFTPDMVFESDMQFLKIDNFIIDCGLYIDKTALIFALTLFAVSFCVQLFAISYMKCEKKNYRFFALLNLFNFSMIGLFFSPNLFQTYFFWEISGIVSYLLIGFEYFLENKSFASRKVFIINRIGDTALIGAIIICSYLIFTYAPNRAFTTLSFANIDIISNFIYAYTSTPLYVGLCSMFIIAAAVKSAQFPFYTWLQDAMEAKLPVSALLHSATLVASGVFLLLRLLPFFTMEESTLKIIIVIGILTTVICSLSACTQTNPKKTLAYSTSAQLGLMFCSIGLLNIKAAIAFFAAHALIKSTLFINLPKENEKWNYTSFILFLISGLSLSGLLFSGMIAKEMLTENFGRWETIGFSLISFLTAFYIIRIALVVYDRRETEKIKPNFVEIYTNLILLLMNIGLYIYLHKTCQYKIAEPFWAGLTAWICVYILYIKNAFFKVPIIYPLAFNGFYLDKIYMNICVKLYEIVAQICNFIDTKILGNYNVVTFAAKAGVKTFGWVENNIMNAAVKNITLGAKKLSTLDLKAQSGNIQHYNAYAFIIITLVITALIFAYTAILGYIGG